MTSEQINLLIIIAVGVVFVACMVYILTMFLKRQAVKKHGIHGPAAVAKALNKYKRRHMKLINDITLPDHGKQVHFDHILIGYFGLLAIDTNDMRGEIYGTKSDKEWTNLHNNKRMNFPNPVVENQNRLNTLRYLFQQAKIFKTKMEGLIVVADLYTDFYIDRGLPIYTMRQLKKYFKRPLFQEDNGTDVDKIYETILKNKIN